jgi:tRNA 5-methylaminomethyl-2-thiouridine biosynthesis bifunctional protein
MRHAAVQQEVLAQWNYPQQYARWADAQEASALIGAATPHGGWLFGQGGWARPSSLCEAMLAACGDRLQRVFCTEALRLLRVGDEWQVRDAGGQLIAQAPTVILASGAGAGNSNRRPNCRCPNCAARSRTCRWTCRRRAAAGGLPRSLCNAAVNGIVCAGATYDNDDDPRCAPAASRKT